MTTEDDLRSAIETAAVHLKPDAMALFVPDDITDTYKPSSSQGGHDIGGRSLRYTESHGPMQPGTNVVEVRFTYVLRDGESERVEEDTHLTGVFPRATWLRLLDDAGLDPLELPYVHSEVDHEMVMFVGYKRP
jgi:hypothetical protein